MGHGCGMGRLRALHIYSVQGLCGAWLRAALVAFADGSWVRALRADALASGYEKFPPNGPDSP